MSETSSHASPTEGVLQQFVLLALQFLSASAEVWPEDALIARWKARADAAQSESLMPGADGLALRDLGVAMHAAFHENFKNHYELLRTQDDAALLRARIPVLEELGAAAKWQDADASVRQTVWQYTTELGQLSSMLTLYQKCPGGIMSKVTNLASSIAARVDAGEMDMSSINPLQLSQQMLSGMDQADLDAFGRELLSGGGDMQGLMGMMQGMVGTMGGAAGMPDIAAMMRGGGGGGGMGDIAALLSGGGLGGLGGLLGNGPSSKDPFSNMKKLN